MKKIKSSINDASTLPGEFYSSEDYFKKTKEDLFPCTWQLIGSPEVIKTSSFAYPFTFLEGFIDEPLVFINDQKGELNCFSNVCTHRGNILIQYEGPIKKQLICGYHGRRFSNKGDFLSMPESDGMNNFPCKEDNLTNVPYNKWKQFLFSSLDPKINFKDFIQQMEDKVGWLPIENFKYDTNLSRDYLVKANWALYCDNYLEGFHIPFIHKDLAQSLDYSLYNSEISSYSNLQVGYGKGAEFCFDIPKDHPDYGSNIAAYYFWLFPNMMFNFYPWGLSTNLIKPLTNELTKVEFRSYVWDKSKLDFGAGALLDKVEREDEAVVESVQRGVKSRFYKAGRYSPRMEKGVHHFHQLISKFINS